MYLTLLSFSKAPKKGPLIGSHEQEIPWSEKKKHLIASGTKKSLQTVGPTGPRTPKKPEYLIARLATYVLIIRGPLGFGPIQ